MDSSFYIFESWSPVYLKLSLKSLQMKRNYFFSYHVTFMFENSLFSKSREISLEIGRQGDCLQNRESPCQKGRVDSSDIETRQGFTNATEGFFILTAGHSCILHITSKYITVHIPIYHYKPWFTEQIHPSKHSHSKN